MLFNRIETVGIIPSGIVFDEPPENGVRVRKPVVNATRPEILVSGLTASRSKDSFVSC